MSSKHDVAALEPLVPEVNKDAMTVCTNNNNGSDAEDYGDATRAIERPSSLNRLFSSKLFDMSSVLLSRNKVVYVLPA